MVTSFMMSCLNMNTKKRQGVRPPREQLVTLLNGWDPAGVLKAGGARDSYASIADSVLGLLSREADATEISAFLDGQIRDEFGVMPHDSLQFANKAIIWFKMASRE